MVSMPSTAEQTFATFVISSSNRFSHAAVAVAEASARAYDPLVIWGPSGVDKGHLLHATGDYTRRLHPDLSQRYVAAGDLDPEDFAGLVEPDVLLDDLHLVGASLDGLNVLLLERDRRHRQTVLTSGRSPREIDGFNEFFRPRFEWG